MPKGKPGPPGRARTDRPDRISALAAATDAFSEAVPDIDALLSIVAEQISRATGDFCSVVLLTAHGSRIEPVAAYHPDPRVLKDASVRVGVPIDIDASGPWKAVLQERRSMVLSIDPDHLPANVAPHQARHIRTWRIRQAAMIPMIAQDRVVGGLNLNRMEGSPPLQEDDLKLLESLAGRAARAISTAQAIRDQRLLAEELEARVAERTKELEAANHFLDSMIENIPNMIFVKDAADLRFVRFNRAGEDLLGFSRDDLIGKNDFDFFPAEQAEQFVSADTETLRNHRLVDIPEENIETRSKGTRILHTKKIPILGSSGEPSFLLGISEDITEAKKVQEALVHAQEEAERANRAKSEFLANMSHELRTPLNSILGFSSLLIDDAAHRFDDGTRQRFLAQIRTSGQHLLALINDVLDLSKVEAGQMDLHLEPVELGQLLDEVRATVEPLARDKTIELRIEPSAELRITADAVKVRQMVLNLISNAIKFTPAGGHIVVARRRDESWVEIAVSDSGMGIAEQDLAGLFTEFHQLDPRPGQPREGTGLGLALTRRFAMLHGGQVTVASALGKGSTFTLRLPIEAAPRQAHAPASPHRVEAVDPSRPLVLVVEDNAQAAEILSRHLHGGGFRTELARTGPEAIAMARQLRPLAITLDILLPEVDGWEVLNRLKTDETTHDIPVVVVSVVDNPALGRALGALDYFVKPVDGKALLARLSQYTFMNKMQDGPVRVLVVDDEPANLDMLDALLTPAGFGVLKAGGGRQGIDTARSQLPDLILLDLMMPDVTGFDVVEALRAEEATHSIPIMVLTAKQLTEADKATLNGQVAAVFQRNSVAGPELTAWLRTIVAKRRTS